MREAYESVLFASFEDMKLHRYSLIETHFFVCPEQGQFWDGLRKEKPKARLLGPRSLRTWYQPRFL